MLMAAVIGIAVTIVAFWAMFSLVEVASEMRPPKSLGETVAQGQKCAKCATRCAEFHLGDVHGHVCGWCLAELLDEREERRGRK